MNRTVAGSLARIALLFLFTSCGLFAGTITYTLVESYPRMFLGDQPTATWVAVTSGYINGPLTFSGPPVLNAAAISDGFAYISGNPVLHTSGSPYALTGIDLTQVEISNGPNIGYGTYDSCAGPLSVTACNITQNATYTSGDDRYNGFGPDSLTVTSSVPEPGTAALAAGGCFMLCSLLWFGRRFRQRQAMERRS
jgi:hypothetical protein